MTRANDDPTNDLPPEHPAAADTAVSAGNVLSGHAWRPDGNVQQGPDVAPSTDRDPDVPGRPPAEGGDDVPPPPERDERPERDDDGAAADVAQFLDVEPPESPAADADIPAPPG